MWTSANVSVGQSTERDHGYIRARVRLLTTEEGGRRTPILSGYRSCWGFPPEVHADLHDGPLVLEGATELGLGEDAIAWARWVRSPQLTPIATACG